MRTARSAALVAASFLSVSVVTGLLLIAGEMSFRAIDGYRLLSWKLVLTGPPAQDAATAKLARKYAQSILPAKGMKPEWFDLSPPALKRAAPSPALLEAARRFGKSGSETEATHVFNWQFVRSKLCIEPPFDKFPGFVFVYDAPNGADRPRYRFPRNSVNPEGLVTNNFGWRGLPIDLRKPEKTIRLAFIGSSTTVNSHNYPFSYPELVGFWLNMWSQQTGLDLKIETINAGREGIDNDDVTAIFQDEIAPLKPDIVVFDGATQRFTPAEYVAQVPDERPGVIPRTRFADYSAIARRLMSSLVTIDAKPMEEPQKPAYDIRWPADLNERDPPLTYPNLPNGLSAEIGNLDQIRGTLERSGGELTLSSFFLLAFDGMKLNPYSNLYDYLNNTLYPYRYADLARMAVFQNRVLQKYAQTYGLEFLNFAREIPPDPALYADAIHALYAGVRLQAWIVAQQLAPLIQLRVSQGRLPRAMGNAVLEHPAFPANERTLAFDCSQRATVGNLLEQLKLGEGVQAIPPALAEFRATLNIHADGDVAANRYLAVIPTTSRTYPDQDFVLAGELLAGSGNINVGVLSADGARFLGSLPVDASSRPVKLQIPFLSIDGRIGPVVISKGIHSGQAASAEITAMSIWTRNDKFIKEYAKGLRVPPQ